MLVKRGPADYKKCWLTRARFHKNISNTWAIFCINWFIVVVLCQGITKPLLHSCQVKPKSKTSPDIEGPADNLKAIAIFFHHNDVIMGAIGSQITSLTIVFSTVYSDADERKHQSSASLAFVRGIHRSPVNSPHKWPVTRNMFPFDDVITINSHSSVCWQISACF